MHIVLIRPGVTDYDDQGRIKGRLDLPLNERGVDQVADMVTKLTDVPLDIVYTAPCESALQTADRIADAHGIKVKTVERFSNLDAGLWQGKRVQDVKVQQPKVYRRWQDDPSSVCPPEGEMVASAQRRVQEALERIRRKHRGGTVAIVVPEPLATVMRCQLTQAPLAHMWDSECNGGCWDTIELPRGNLVTS